VRGAGSPAINGAAFTNAPIGSSANRKLLFLADHTQIVPGVAAAQDLSFATQRDRLVHLMPVSAGNKRGLQEILAPPGKDAVGEVYRRVYLDFNASTPVAPEVIDAMRTVLEEPYGNPSSAHWAGSPAKEAVDKARMQIAGLLGCEANEIVLTSGGSEANNHALKGVFFASGKTDVHIITTQVEHPAVINPCKFLEQLGATVTYVRVDGFGRVDPDDVRRALRPGTILIS
jgi:aspartate/methionine/tyrosine aminotransferase